MRTISNQKWKRSDVLTTHFVSCGRVRKIEYLDVPFGGPNDHEGILYIEAITAFR
jgi:hypothetical protein